MLFTTLPFFLLLLVTWILYYSTSNGKLQLAVAIVGSIVFYAWNSPVLLILLLLTALVNAGVSYVLDVTQSQNQRRGYAILGVGINLSILSFFKYGPLISETFYEASSVGAFLLSVPLPLGISFYILQGISLVIDTFREPVRPSTSIKRRPSFVKHTANITLFITFFPQLVAGPIVKAREFIPQIRAKQISGIRFEPCFKNLVLGYFLKMFVADNLKDQTFWIAYPYFEAFSIVELLILLIGYTVQIFADFAGYSLIAIGLGGLFGYQLKDNFKYPFIATSFSEFWRRWHISLSSFLMEYLYIPLGGNRGGKVRTYLNLMITMTLGGLWHGTMWSYALWGFYHGMALSVERFFWENYESVWRSIPSLVKGIGVFGVFAIGLLFHKLPNLLHISNYLICMITNPLLPAQSGAWMKIFFVMTYASPVVVYHANYWGRQVYHYQPTNQLAPLWYGTMLFFVLLNSGSTADFFYFQF